MRRLQHVRLGFVLRAVLVLFVVGVVLPTVAMAASGGAGDRVAAAAQLRTYDPKPLIVSVTGSVVDSDTSAPVAGATVTLVYWNAESSSYLPTGTATTDSEGIYTFFGRQSGISYSTKVVADGYDWYVSPMVLMYTGSTPLVFDARLQAKPPACELSVSVVETSTGNPIPGVTVSIGHIVSPGACDWGTNLTTDAMGRVTFTDLPKGDYTLSTWDPSQNYIDMWYPGFTAYSSANDLHFTTYAQDMDLTQRLTKYGHIKGRATSRKDGSPVAGIAVGAYAKNGPAVRSTTTDAEGYYDIGQLAQGTYRIYFSSQYDPVWCGTMYPGIETCWADSSVGNDVVLGFEDVEDGVNQTLVKYGRITGHVRDMGTNEPVGAQMMTYYKGVAYSPSTFVAWDVYPATSDHTFTLCPPGDYKLAFQAVDGIHTDSFYPDTAHWSEATTFTVIDGETFDVTQHLFAASTLQGRVTRDDTGEGLAGVQVTRYVSAEGTWTAYGAPLTTDSNGDYTGATPQGLYRLEFSDPASGRSVWYHDAFSEDAPRDALAIGYETTVTAALQAIDTTVGAPVVSIVGSGTVEATLTITAADVVSGIESVRYTVNGQPLGGNPYPAGGVRFTTPGVYTVVATARDHAGNSAVSAPATFTVKPAPGVVSRVDGANRYEVAANLARKGWDPSGTKSWPKVTDVIIANGESGKEADPLSAAGLAGAYDAPVLLVQAGSLPAATRTAITEIAAKNPKVRIHIVGGTGSVPDARWAQIKAIPGVFATKDRLAGSDRYDVSVQIAKRIVSIKGIDNVSGVLIIAADNTNAFYDALAASPASFAKTMPMIGVRKTSVPPGTATLLSTTLAGRPRFAVSSSAYLAAGVLSATGASTRLTTSSNRYEAASQIASATITRTWLTAADSGIAAKLPDALTGGALLGKRGGVLLFTDSSATLQTSCKAFISGRASGISNGWVFGGTGSVPAAQETQLRNLVK